MPPSASLNERRTIHRPMERFGFRPGDDRRLIRWAALRAYFRDIASMSDRVDYQELGPVTGDQVLALLTISSPQNLGRRDELQAIQRRLADQRPALSPHERAHLLSRGRSVCLITCSVHPTEVGGTLMTPDLVYRLATDNGPETERILDEVVLLLLPSLNPHGWELVNDWYEETLGTPFEGSPPPRLYHPVAGHDNNRDWFMQVLPETRAVVTNVHNAWYPHIVHDLHQMQPNGPRYVVPPYIDPYDPNVDPLIQAQINALGSEIAAELTSREKAGVATSCIFDAFSPSRAYMHYHGGVRILSEAASVRIASPITLWVDQLVETRGFNPRQTRATHPEPWQGGTWTLADIVDYNTAAVWAVLRHAARYRDRWLSNFSAIQRRALAMNGPFAFVIPPLSVQRDPTSAYELLRVLQQGGVEVERAAAPFATTELDLPVGSFVVRVAQPFGRFAKTLLEAQRYPDLTPLGGGAPPQPYDITAHSLPLQMGVTCHEVREEFSVRLERIEPVSPPVGTVLRTVKDSGRYVFSVSTNASARLANHLLGSGARLSRCPEGMMIEGHRLDAGAFVVKDVSVELLCRLTAATGVDALPIAMDRPLATRDQTAPRVALYRSWRPDAMDAGWTEHVLHEYGFSPRTLRDRDIRKGGLNDDLDVVILAHETAKQIREGNSPGDYPPEYVGGIGDVGARNLRQFVEQGGTLVALDGATELAIQALYLPVVNVLDGVSRDTFSSPGSLVRILVDRDHPVGWGFEREAVGMFVSSPAFDVRSSETSPAVVVASYPLTAPLLAGWMHGPEHLSGRAAVVEVEVGQGRVILLGLRTQFRAQARGTYRLLFNSIYRAGLS